MEHVKNLLLGAAILGGVAGFFGVAYYFGGEFVVLSVYLGLILLFLAYIIGMALRT